MSEHEELAKRLENFCDYYPEIDTDDVAAGATLIRQQAAEIERLKAPHDWPVDASEAACRLMSLLGIAADASMDPGADWRRDRVASAMEEYALARARSRGI